MNAARKALVDLRTDADAGFTALEAELDAAVLAARAANPVFRVRNVINGAVTLSTYTVASNAAVNDAVLNVEGDLVLVINQATPAQNGIYVVGVVAVGVAPLTRSPLMPAAATLLSTDVIVRSGTLFGNTKWFSTAVAPVIGTTDPAFYPESVTQSVALVAGTTTITNVPVLSATKSNVIPVRRIADTCSLTTGGYGPSVNALNGITAGALGTASVVVEAMVAAGTKNVADVSTLNITIVNR
jgi:hypothetical protein